MIDKVETDLHNHLSEQDQASFYAEYRSSMIKDIADKVLNDEKVFFGSHVNSYICFDDVMQHIYSSASREIDFCVRVRNITKYESNSNQRNAVSDMLSDFLIEQANELAEKYVDAHIAYINEPEGG